MTDTVALLPICDLLRAALPEQGRHSLAAAIGACPAYVGESIALLVPELRNPTDTSWGRPADDDQWWRQRMYAAIRAAFSALAAAGPLALVIEDVHWADTATLDLLEYLLSTGTGPGVPVVLSYRTDDPDVPRATAEWLGRRVRSAAAEVLDLAPLTLEETEQQIEMITGRRPADSVAAAVFARSEGNPLFTEQLADGPVAPGNRQPTTSLTASFAARLDRLSRAALAVAGSLAIAARPMTSEHLQQLSLLDEDEVREGLQELRALRLLHQRDEHGAHRLRHAVLEDIVAAALLPVERAGLHARTAAALASRPEPGLGAEIAEHWQRAGSVVDELPWRVRAAEDATALYAPAQAAYHWLRVISIWDAVGAGADQLAGRPLHEVYLLTEAALTNAGSSDRAAALMEQAVSRLTEAAMPIRARLLARLADGLSRPDPDRAEQLFLEAAELFAGAPTREYVNALVDQAALQRRRGHYRQALDTVRLAVRLSAECGDQAQPRALLMFRACCEVFVGDVEASLHSRELAASVAGSPSVRDDTVAAIFETNLLFTLGRFDEVVSVGEPILRRLEALNLDAAIRSTTLRGNVADALLMLGHVDRAAELLEPSSELTFDAHLVDDLRAELEIIRGQYDRARTRLTRLYDVLPEWSGHQVDAARVWAELDLWESAPQAVWDRLVPAIRSVGATDVSRIADWPLALAARAAGDLVAALPPEGRRTRGEALRAELETLRAGMRFDPLGQPAIPSTSRASAATWVAELARLSDESAGDTWEVAAAQWERLRMPFPTSYCHWRRSEALLTRRTGRAQAGDSLRRARELSRGHVPLTAAIDRTAELARITLDVRSGRDEPPVAGATTTFGLTSRELEVLRQLGQGKTNSEIGAALYVSAKTASVHVTNILRKLGVTNRAHAAAVAERAGLLD